MLLGYLLIFIFVVFDQLTKQLARIFLMETGDKLIWIPRLLEIQYHENDGMSFGLFSGQQALFAFVTVIALLIFGYLFKDISFKTKKMYSWSVVLFIAGTLGNAIDRLIYGFVIDFIHYPFLDGPLRLIGLNNFYNNIADMVLSLAIVLFTIDMFVFEPKRTKKEVSSDENHSH